MKHANRDLAVDGDVRDPVDGKPMPKLRIVGTVDGNLVVVVFDQDEYLEGLARHQGEGVAMGLFGAPLLLLDRVAYHPGRRREHGTQVQRYVVPRMHVGTALEVDGEASRRRMWSSLNSKQSSHTQNATRNRSHIWNTGIVQGRVHDELPEYTSASDRCEYVWPYATVHNYDEIITK